MSQYLLEPEARARDVTTPGRRKEHTIDDTLLLTELDPDKVIDQLEPEDSGIDLISFGTMREVCPKCQQSHLKLILRQRRVRFAHLFCGCCLSCFDAHYPNGASALTI